MKGKQFFLILLFVLLGSLTRLIFALKYEMWNLAPDQIAWELNLQELITNWNWSYDRLIHYPHEGGTILISLLALLFKPFTATYSLVCAAIVIDFCSRWIQLLAVRRIFGEKALLFYGLWSICSIPLLMAWTGLNFGLHSLAAIFPFLFLLLCHRSHPEPRSYVWDGVFVAFAGWFMYSNFLLLVAATVLLLSQKKIKELAYMGLGFVPIILLHLLVRSNAYVGFELATFDPMSIRGEEFDWFNWSNYKLLYQIWVDVIYQVSLFPDTAGITKTTIRIAWYLISVLGIAVSAFFAIKKKVNALFYPAMLILVVYVSVYALSPFYLEFPNWANYINSRHLTYILPLFVLLSLIGFSQNKWLWSGGISLIALSILGFVQFMQEDKVDAYLSRPAGWVIATKYGHDPSRVIQLLETDTANRTELLIGVGWGTATSLFADTMRYSEQFLDQQTKRLENLIVQYPKEDQLKFAQGIEYAFSDQVTPLLDEDVRVNRISPILNKFDTQE